MKHTCHFPPGKTEVPPKMFMCFKHWNQVSKKTQRRVWAAYNSVEHDSEGRCEEVTKEYCDATDAGIAEVYAYGRGVR